MAKEVLKLQQLSEGDKNPHIQQLLKNYNELASAHNTLVEAFNKNFNTWNGIIQHLDARLGATQSVCQDMLDLVASSRPASTAQLNFLAPVQTTVDLTGDMPKTRVNWAAYIENYLKAAQAEAMQLQQVTAMAKEELAADPLITPPASEETAEDDDAVDSDFGGDLEHAQA